MIKSTYLNDTLWFDTLEETNKYYGFEADEFCSIDDLQDALRYEADGMVYPGLHEILEGRKRDVAILMEDNKTEYDAEKHLDEGTVVFEHIEDWWNFFDNDFQQGLMAEYDTDEDGIMELALAGEFHDTSVVEYEGNKYIIEYMGY